jgi:hypothetical protein
LRKADAHLVKLFALGERSLGRGRDLGYLEVVLVGVLVDQPFLEEYAVEALECRLEQLAVILELLQFDVVHPVGLGGECVFQPVRV